MSVENVVKVTGLCFRDNKLVDLCAAIATGLSLFLWDRMIFPSFSIGGPPTFAETFQKGAIRTGAFVVSALILFVWKHHLRARWGWIPIAILGLLLLAKVNDMIWEATIAERDREPILEAFRYFEIYFYFLPVLITMGAAHYVGKFISRKLQRFPLVGSAI